MSSEQPSEESTSANKAKETIRDVLLKKVREDRSLPTLGASMTKVVQISSSNENSVTKLAHFVLEDVALTQKILRLSNTINYRTSSGTPVTTISRAIFLLGFDMIKASASAMLLVDCFKNKTQAHSVRKELVHALCASTVAREFAQKSKFHDAEEVAVAALFKNVGRLLVASFDHSLYAKMRSSTSDASHQGEDLENVLLGCSFEKFGELALHEWNIPDTIIQSLSGLTNGELKKPAHRNEWLKQVTAFSDAVANIILERDPADRTQQVQNLFQRYGKALEIDQEQLQELLSRVSWETRQLAASLDIELHSIIGGETVEKSGLALPEEFLLKSYGEVPAQKKTYFASGKPHHARDLLLAGVQDVTQMLASDKPRLNDMIMLVLETLYTSMGFRFATACLRNPQMTAFAARVSLGEQYLERQRRFTFPIAPEHDIFHLAMNNNIDLVISDAFSPKVQGLLPEWHKTLFPDTRSFIVLPLVLQTRPIGLFYADRKLPAEEGIPPDETALLRTLKSQLLAAFMRT